MSEADPVVPTPEAKQEPSMEEQHKQLAVDMFQKISEYLNGELAGKNTLEE